MRQVEVSAVLYLENELVSGAFTRERVSALELIAAQAAIALANAELFEKLERENAERRRAEVFLNENRELLQQIIDNSTAVVFVKDAHGRFILSNRAFEELFHMAREDILGKTDRELSGRDSADTLRSHDMLAHQANRPLEFEERLKLLSVRTYIAIKFPLATLPEGRVRGLVLPRTSRRASASRTSSEAASPLLQATLESTGDAILVLDTEGRVVQFNHRFVEIWDIPPETLRRATRRTRLAVRARQAPRPGRVSRSGGGGARSKPGQDELLETSSPGTGSASSNATRSHS